MVLNRPFENNTMIQFAQIIVDARTHIGFVSEGVLMARLMRLRKKDRFETDLGKSIPQGLKPGLILLDYAGLKPRPT
jgi:hypothetical protein